MPVHPLRLGAVRSIATALAAIAASAVTPAAFAHGGIPKADDIRVDPGDPEHVVVRANVWGVFHSHDGGKTWKWTCAEPYGGDSITYERRGIALGSDGAIWIASDFDGLQVSRDDGCSFEVVEAFGGDAAVPEVIQDVTTWAKDPTHMAVVSTQNDGGTLRTSIWESTDSGGAWSPIGEIAGGFSASEVEIAPSDGERVYVTGKQVASGSPSVGKFARSVDHGKTWDLFDSPTSHLPPGDDGSIPQWTPRIAGVSPVNPDIVFFWVDHQEDYGQDVPDSVYLSTDGGKKWTKVFDGKGDLPGFSFSPDGSEIVVAGPGSSQNPDGCSEHDQPDGIWHGKVSDLAAKGGAALSRAFDGKAWALAWTKERLYGGHDDFSGGGKPKFTVGVSKSGGASWDPSLVICDVKMTECPAGTVGADRCPALFDDPLGGFKKDFIDSQRCTAGPAKDAGVSDACDGKAEAGAGGATDDTKDADTSKCACSSAPRRGSPLAWVSAMIVVGVSALRRRRFVRTY